MSDDPRMSLIKDIFEEFARCGTAELLLQHVAPDVVYRTTAPPGTPLDGRFVGRDGIADYFGRAHACLEVTQVQMRAYLGQGDTFVVLGTEHLRHRATQRARTSEWATVVHFGETQIREIVVIEDLSILLAP